MAKSFKINCSVRSICLRRRVGDLRYDENIQKEKYKF